MHGHESRVAGESVCGYLCRVTGLMLHGGRSGTCVEVIERGGRRSVPEAYASVRCASPGSQQAMLVGGPGDGLHCSCVVRELQHRGAGLLVPDVQLVVVAARRYLPVVRRPFQPAHLHIGKISKAKGKAKLGL